MYSYTIVVVIDVRDRRRDIAQRAWKMDDVVRERDARGDGWTRHSRLPGLAEHRRKQLA